MNPDIRPWFNGEYKVHCSKEVYDAIVRWKGCRFGGVYVVPNGPKEYDVIVPESLVKKVSQTLKVATKPALNDNDLRDPESPLSDDK